MSNDADALRREVEAMSASLSTVQKLLAKRTSDEAADHAKRPRIAPETVPAEASDLNAIRDQLRSFAQARDWDQFHTPRNLCLALVGEVGELAECFQWKPDANCDSGLDQWEEKKKVHLGEELADVTCYLVRLADKCGVDLPGAISNKLAKNAAKYPADRVRGSSAKYDEYKEYHAQHQHQQASDGASKA
jgi:dCTP diphosphatase